jgi:hypothetical protein
MNNDGSWLDPLFETFDQFLVAALGYLPTLLSAVAVLAVGLSIAWALKAIVLRVSVAVSMLIRRTTGVRSATHVRFPWPLSVVFANVIFWLAAVFFLAVSLRILGLPGIADWIAAAATYLPRVLAAAVIILGGYMIASIARDGILRIGKDTHSEQSALFSQIVFFGLNVIAIIVGVNQLGIDLSLVQSIVLIGMAAAAGGFAFAFGMGASRSLDNIIASYYVRKVYRRGQRVRLGHLEGEILDLTPTAVILDTTGGRALVPAKKFIEDISLLLGHEETVRDQ